jgi:hypothetical protein
MRYDENADDEENNSEIIENLVARNVLDRKGFPHLLQRDSNPADNAQRRHFAAKDVDDAVVKLCLSLGDDPADHAVENELEQPSDDGGNGNDYESNDAMIEKMVIQHRKLLCVCTASGFVDRNFLHAEWTIVGRGGDNLEPQHRELRIRRYVEPNLSAAAIDDASRADHLRACRPDDLDDLRSRSARRDNIFTHKNPLASLKLKTAPKLHDAVFPFGKHHPETCGAAPEREKSADLLADYDSSQRRSHHRVDAGASEVIGDLRAEKLRVAGVLQDLRTLKVLRAVQTRCQLEMPFEQRVCTMEDGEDFVASHGRSVIS